MRLPSSSSLLLASLAISSSSSSLSALAAPTGDCPEDSSSPAPVPHGSDDTMAQPNNHLQSRGLVGDVHKKIIDPLLGSISDLLPLNARDVPLDTFNLIPRAEGSEEGGTDDAPEDPSPQPPPSEPQASAPSPAAVPAPPAAAPAPPAAVPALPVAAPVHQLPGSLPVRRDPGVVPGQVPGVVTGLISPIANGNTLPRP